MIKYKGTYKDLQKLGFKINRKLGIALYYIMEDKLDEEAIIVIFSKPFYKGAQVMWNVRPDPLTMIELELTCPGIMRFVKEQ